MSPRIILPKTNASLLTPRVHGCTAIVATQTITYVEVTSRERGAIARSAAGRLMCESINKAPPGWHMDHLQAERVL